MLKKQKAFTLAEVENSEGLKTRHYEECNDEVIQFKFVRDCHVDKSTRNDIERHKMLNKFFRIFQHDRLSAFTLAEVLITLGIIGVVAAMTIPTLMQKTNDAEIVSGVLKANSVLSNAAKEVEAVEGYKIKDLDEDTFKTYYVSHLNTLGSCENYDICLADGSGLNIPNFYEGCSEDLSSEGSASALRESCAKLDFDVNGSKGPNKYGHDQYSIALTRTGVVPLGQQDSCSGGDCTNYVVFNRKLYTGNLTDGHMEKGSSENEVNDLPIPPGFSFGDCGPLDTECYGNQSAVCVNGRWKCQ